MHMLGCQLPHTWSGLLSQVPDVGNRQLWCEPNPGCVHLRIGVRAPCVSQVGAANASCWQQALPTQRGLRSWGSHLCSLGHFTRPQLVSTARPHPAWERRPLPAACPLAGPSSRRGAAPGAHWSPLPCLGPPHLTPRPPQGLGGILWWCESPPSQGPAGKPRPEA